ncbi:hypothetical protein ECC01_22195 [Bacillus tequilensis]|nr:hypothetical protein [Bacillus tequilensis]
MHIDIMLNGRTTRAMVDVGATHNFIADLEAKRLGLILKKSPSRMKVVNLVVKRIFRLAKESLSKSKHKAETLISDLNRCSGARLGARARRGEARAPR